MKNISNPKKETRTRNYATVVYPESAADNWKDILSHCLIPCFISPLHDRDVNPTGEIKKAHYHVIIMFDGPKTLSQAQEIFSLIGGVGCEAVKSIRSYSRYLCHLDNPDKAQYLTDDVVCLSGSDYFSCIGLPVDKYKAISEMIEFIKINDIISYSELLDYCSVNRFDWFRVLCDSATIVVKEYLKSRDWTKSRNKDYYVS